MKKQQPKMIDPYMQDVPYDIIRDNNGKVIGEVFQLPTEQLEEGKVKRRKKVKK